MRLFSKWATWFPAKCERESGQARLAMPPGWECWVCTLSGTSMVEFIFKLEREKVVVVFILTPSFV